MQEILTIKKDPSLKDSQNYALLKEAGLKHIEQLASDLWTDYNEHDPGVTLLEVLAYAITDLGFRTGYDIKDVLTAKSEAYKNHKDTFHKATQILPCNQVTELDLREILIDIKGVRNAWINIATDFENTYFVDYDASVLSVTDPVSTTKEEITSLNGIYHIVIEFDRLVIPLELPVSERREKEGVVMSEAKDRLMQYRNFCEDYFVGTRKHSPSNAPVTRVVKRQEKFEKVVVWADVEVTPDSDKEKVHAQIYFDIEQFLIPYVTFYSLQERLSQKKTIDQIFEGPLLDHGFIDEDELDNIQPLEEIHVSDLYQVVMDVPGVTGVKSIKVANYLSDNGKDPASDISIEQPAGTFNLKKLLLARGEDWCLDLFSDPSTCTFHELVLDTVTSDASDPINNTIKFYTGENSVPVRLDTSRTLDELNVLRQNDRKRRERLGQLSFELEVPEGIHRDLNEYYPVQNELPAVYGTGLAGLADEASDVRKGQAKQLKGYLLFFEQILANYLAQLNNIRHLFSWDDTIDKTYYTQVLENIKDTEALYVEEVDNVALFDQGDLLKDVLGDFIQSDTEAPEVYFDRRSRFLNHLIARFNEQFVQYSLVMHSLNMEDRLIPDKAKFLKEYDEISMNRGRGFNFSKMRDVITIPPYDPPEEPDVWDTLNVTGYQHRVSRFLGFCDQSRRFLYSGHNMRIETHFDGVDLKYRYVLTVFEEAGVEIFGELKSSASDAISQFEELIELKGRGLGADDPIDISGTEFKFNFEDGSNNILGHSAIYATDTERDDILIDVNAYFEDTSGFITDVVFEAGKWHYTLEISSSSPPFNINGSPRVDKSDAENDLAIFLAAIKADTLSFVPVSPGMVTNGEFYFDVLNNGVDHVGRSDHETFLGSEALMHAGIIETEEFFDDNIGYKSGEGGIHVVEHILLRPKTDHFSLFDVDVKQYDSIATAENPPVAYPVDYSGIYCLSTYHNQYFLSNEVELTSNSAKDSSGQLINENGEKVNIIEPFFYTLSENEVIDQVGEVKAIIDGTTITWEEFLVAIRDGDASKFQLTSLGGELSVDKELWNKLLEEGYGCEYGNYVFGTKEYSGLTFNYYFIMDGNTILGGLASAVFSSDEIKERALRAFAYFCENTTCRGVSNPYEFKATVVLPAWTTRARDYNYRAYAEEIIRIEAPAHVVVDIKWVSRSQMREFEMCYRDWLLQQGEYIYLDRQIQQGVGGISDLAEVPAIGSDGSPYSWLEGTTTNMSNQFLRMVDASGCLIEKIDTLIDAFRSNYKTIIRNDQFFTNAPSTIGYTMAWIGSSSDGSVVNKAKVVGGILPDFLAFFDGENFVTNNGVGQPGDGVIPDTFDPFDFNAGDFVIIDFSIVPPGSWSFSVKTYSDTGQVSCATVTIQIIPDIEAVYTSHPECYSHLVIGDIVSEIDDANGVVVSASILGGVLPASLRLITDYPDRQTWATGHGLDETLYQPGDIVVDSLIAHPVNDQLAKPSEGNVDVHLVIETTDITGGKTVFTTVEPDPGVPVPNNAPGYIPIKIYGNAELIKTPEHCVARHVDTFNMNNPVYSSPSDLLYTFEDAHEPNGITISSASVITETDSGIDVRVVNGKAEIYVQDYVLFEAYIESLPDNSGKVEFPILDLQVIDTCGFVSEWDGTFCVKLDKEAQADPYTTACAGNYYGTPEVLCISDDEDDGIHSYSMDPTVQADLLALGVSYSKTADNKVSFRVTNSLAFRNAIETENIFNGTEVVDGIEANTYSFTVETVDKKGGDSTVNAVIYAPVNGPLECIKAHPDGTSYLAYLNHVSQWNSKIGYTESTQKVGKTVISFSDANGIASIRYSCKKCNGSSFNSGGIGHVEAWWTHGVVNEKVDDNTKYGDDIGIYLDNDNEPEKSKKSQVTPSKRASKSVKRRKGRGNVSEYAWKVNSDQRHSEEQYVKNDLYSAGGVYQYDPYGPQSHAEDCLEKLGLSLDTVSHRIYVSDSKKFIKNGIGTHKFSIIVEDRCGITTCKEVTLVIGDDKDAYYVDVKNKNYLNSLKSGDVIGYPEDPDGGINQARIVMYNPATELIAMPHTPHLLLPPGTRFNTVTGEIKVMQKAVKDDVVPYKGAVSNLKGKGKSSKAQKYQRKTVQKSKPKSNASGYSMFAKESSGKKKVGVAMHNADVQNKTEDLVSPKVEQSKKPLQIQDLANIWISNPGKLTHGTWTINVLTKDILGGLTIITYTIVIKKNKKIKGVLENVGYAKYGNVKTELANNYSNILTKKVSAASQGPDITLKNDAGKAQVQQIGGLSAIDTSKGKSL